MPTDLHTSFRSKMDVIRHILESLPEGEKPHASEIVSRANELVSSLPNDLGSILGVITNKDYYNAISNPKRPQRPKMSGDSPPPFKGAQVRWTDAEEDRLADIVSVMRLSHPMENAIDLCRRAQEQLPEGRRRTIKTTGQIRSVLDKVKIRLDCLKRDAERGRKPQEASPSTPPPTPEEILKDFDDEALLYYITRERGISLTSIIPWAVEQLLSSLLDNKHSIKATSMLETQEAKMDMILDFLTKPVKKEPTSLPQTNGRKRLPRISVYGLKSNQIQEVQRACRNHADINGVNKDILSPHFSTEDDLIFLFADFIDHSLQNKAFSTVGRDKVVLHKGGISTGINEIVKRSRELSHKS